MPFPMKIQPINELQEPARLELAKPVVKSRLKRLFERQFLRNSSAEKVTEEQPFNSSKDGGCGNGSSEFEPSSICLAKMVQNFIEENNEKQSSAAVRCGRNRCNCFNGNCDDSSEDEFDYVGDANRTSSGEAFEILKSLVPCSSVSERNLLADTARIVDKNKTCKRKDNTSRKMVVDGLVALGYDASICKSRWEKSPSYPAGEYEYIDVIILNERLIIDIDFRSEFEIARSTKAYKSVLQVLPYIFVGKSDRLQKIIGVVSDAAKQSLKKKGMHIPPWRKADYIKAKWLSPHTRAVTVPPALTQNETNLKQGNQQPSEKTEGVEAKKEGEEEESAADELVTVVEEWKPPAVKPRSFKSGVRMVTAGLASVIEDEP
ncbi:hypothetical protein Tsubulata_004967 [Turnera subulata]|uniref:Uncharacterized protein n=1 Tax=Turnera subulata TaxID=218843 RepID=A0A9Q0FBR9_9ROSI|nr:hypothetical protein Tsubulata_004967 [Turnera subulata]